MWKSEIIKSLFDIINAAWHKRSETKNNSQQGKQLDRRSTDTVGWAGTAYCWHTLWAHVDLTELVKRDDCSTPAKWSENSWLLLLFVCLTAMCMLTMRLSSTSCLRKISTSDKQRNCAFSLALRAHMSLCMCVCANNSLYICMHAHVYEYNRYIYEPRKRGQP